MTDDAYKTAADAVKRAAAEGELIVQQAREDYGLAASDDSDSPMMQRWLQRGAAPAPPPSPLNAALIEMIRVCIVESERAGRYATAGVALKRLQEHCEAYQVRELPPDEQDWQAIAAKYVPLPAARIAELIGRVSRGSGRLLRCAKCGAGLHPRCACGAPYGGDARPVEAPPLAPTSAATALDRAIAAVTAHPEKSTRALAAEIGVSHQTVKRARQKMGTPGNDVTPDVTPARDQ
jgi:hypothetical protein